MFSITLDNNLTPEHLRSLLEVCKEYGMLDHTVTTGARRGRPVGSTNKPANNISGLSDKQQEAIDTIRKALQLPPVDWEDEDQAKEAINTYNSRAEQDSNPDVFKPQVLNPKFALGSIPL